MSSFDPPSGAEDLAAQAELIEAERAQMEADHAAMLRERQQRKVKQGRAELERRRAELRAELAALDGESLVVEPDGDVVVVDTEPLDTAVSEPDYADADVWDIDPDTGEAYRDEDGNPVPRWPHETIEVKGHRIQVRAAKAAAGAALGLLSSKHVKPEKQNDATLLFCQRHTSPRSFNELMDAMLDPDDEFDMPGWTEVVKRIATMNTARPTRPSRA